jgi:hypothetical protein
MIPSSSPPVAIASAYCSSIRGQEEGSKAVTMRSLGEIDSYLQIDILGKDTITPWVTDLNTLSNAVSRLIQCIDFVPLKLLPTNIFCYVR